MSKQLLKRIDLINNGPMMKNQISMNFDMPLSPTKIHNRGTSTADTNHLNVIGSIQTKNESYHLQTMIEDEDGVINSHKISESIPEKTYRICTIMLFTF